MSAGSYENLLRLVCVVDQLPPEFDISFYRIVHDDLAHLPDAALEPHFEVYGKGEGRIASAAALREGLIATIDKNAALLEIGPFNRPIFRGPNVRYFDVLDQQDLQARAVKHGLYSDSIPKIDYISPVGDLSIVDRKFDRVISSHCIEHQPDLVNHLQQVASVLNPGGQYYLIIPDKRYCFDHFLPCSTLEEITEAHQERRKTHSFNSIYEHYALTTHNDSRQHWLGNHGDPDTAQHDRRSDEAKRVFAEANGEYIDVHAWKFTPTSFKGLITELHASGLSPLRVERVYDTVKYNNEFTAVLKLA